MTGLHHPSSVLTLLVLLTSASLLHPSTSNHLSSHEDGPGEGVVPGDRRFEEVQSVLRRLAEEEEREEELFRDVDPRELAAVLLEALNSSQVERRVEEEQTTAERREEEEQTTAERREEEEQTTAERRVVRGDEEHQERAERPELELLMASQAKQREEEEQRKALEEEEKLTERVTSRTSSQTVQTRTEQNSNTSAGVTPRPEAISPEEEEQLSPEELRSLENMMKEFPRLNVKREEQRGSRTSRTSFNDIEPIFKGSELAWSKKKLKWQEETQKALHLPTFRGGNAVDEPQALAPPPTEQEQQQEQQEEQLSPEQEEQQEQQQEQQEQQEEQLSPEQEEAEAREEQEEMMRQAAEVRRAQLQEEELADAASDLLLRYLVKQNHGTRKSGWTGSSWVGSSAAEDKRSEEVQEQDLDPQTIDQLIEISSKLHLPAEDVVDIISDVEKKRKDVPAETPSPRRPAPLPSNAVLVSRQPAPAAGVLRTWFQDRRKPAGSGFWSKPKSLVVQPDRRPVWTGYQSYPSLRDYYPVYLPAAHRLRPRYYVHLNRVLDGSAPLPLYGRYRSWVPPRLRKPPPGLRHSRYPVSRTWSSVPARLRPAAGLAGTKDQDLERFIQLVLMDRPQRMD